MIKTYLRRGLRLAVLLIAALLFLLPSTQRNVSASESRRTDTVETPHLTAQLIADKKHISGNESFRIGILFSLQPHWHIYWKNPGDSGLAPTIHWQLPEGFTVEPLQWPAPTHIPLGPLANYGYEDNVLLFAQVTAPPDLDTPVITLRARADWLVCKEECIPESGQFRKSLSLGQTPQPSSHLALFAKAGAHVPGPIEGWRHEKTDAADETITITFSAPPSVDLTNYAFRVFPERRQIIEPSAIQQVKIEGSTLRITIPKSPQYSPLAAEDHAVLRATSSPGSAEELAPIRFAFLREPVIANGTRSNDSMLAPPVQSESTNRFWFAVGGAFLGGLLLNLMPCVFPILAIKVMGLLSHSHAGGSAARLHGLAFAAGVLVSMWLLAAALLLLRAAGQQLGWGFQLQSPPMVWGLCLLFFMLGLIFLNVITIGNKLMNIAGSVSLSSGYAGSFGSGLLATAVATPCSAPFMGSALGVALTLSPLYALFVFTGLALGMALPFTALTFAPGLTRLLPKPGAWMEYLKQFLAFPLFATCIWLLWVLSIQVGAAGVLLSLCTLLATAFLLWSIRIYVESTRSKRATFFFSLAVVVSLASVWFSYPNSSVAPSTPEQRKEPSALQSKEDSFGLLWHTYTPTKIAELQQEGFAVYVDFTAAWCLTCQVNKNVVFSSESVKNFLARNKVALVKADWTSRSPVITEALSAHNRSSVPLNLIYPPAHASADRLATQEPIVLPTVLTPQIVLEALQQVVNPGTPL